MEHILNILPNQIRQQLLPFSPSMMEEIEEIRVRIGRPLEVLLKGNPRYPGHYIVTKEDGIHLLNQLSQFSLYTIEEELKQGYITIQGGHRVGLAGKVITEKGQVKAIRDITSYNIRIAKQVIGAAESVIPHLYENGWYNTMIIGPPQTGKTTIIRDIARIVSTGNPSKGIDSSKVGIVDERSEIAGCVKGIPQHELGPRIDVLDACPKAEGMIMMIRSMSPEILVVDEIGRKEDVEAIMEAVHAGVSLIVTAHGFGLEDLYKRPSVKPLMEMGIFDRFIELSRHDGVGTIKRMRNRSGDDIIKKVRVIQP